MNFWLSGNILWDLRATGTIPGLDDLVAAARRSIYVNPLPSVEIEMDIAIQPLSSDGYLWQRSERFWFADGDIILSAQLTENARKLYRVHRLRVSVDSTRLHEALFNVPDNENMEMYEGLPLYHVMDAALDFETFLTYVYDPQDLQISPYDSNTCLLYSTLLRVSKTYRMAGLREELSTYLEFVWPSSLEEWDQRTLRYETIASHYTSTESPEGRYLDDCLAEPIVALRLFREHDLFKHLPSAFYELSLISPTADWHAMHEDPGRQSARSRWLLSSRIRSARWALLTTEDHMCLHKGLRQMQILSLTMIPPDNELCLAPPCVHGRLYIQLVILHEINRFRDVLGILRYYCQDQAKQTMLREGVCAECVQKIGDFMRKKRQHIFDNLAHFFDLPSPRGNTSTDTA
ncbi:hypothetical protein D9615_007508 [Tricholomella constricta]|uniref:BTB domain-containing protein n=1 Tax=Tricholomella constricta TaxID=117010 RepID=A0A8H5M260_9AGAR|nr:hypothetical protein D9615_007508 [Tricholomella constricta]